MNNFYIGPNMSMNSLYSGIISSDYVFGEFEAYNNNINEGFPFLNNFHQTSYFYHNPPKILKEVSNIKYAIRRLHESLHVAKFLEPLADSIKKEAFDMFYNKEIDQIVKFYGEELDELKRSNDLHKWRSELEFDLCLRISYIRNIAQISLIDCIKNKKVFLLEISIHELATPLKDVKPSIIHELVHMIDMINSNAIIPHSAGLSPDADQFIYELLYTFSPKEINARMSEVYYTLISMSQNEIQEIKDYISNAVKKYKERSFKSIQTPDAPTISDYNNAGKYWNLITLYDKMSWIIYKLENLKDKEKTDLVKGLLKADKEYNKIKKEFYPDFYIEANKQTVKEFFGVSIKTSIERNIKRVIAKCKIIQEKYTQKLWIIFKDIETN